MKIPFTRPDITGAELAAVHAVLESGWLVSGPAAARFEAALSARCGTRRTVCVSSATAGLELTLRMLGIGPGNEVVVPVYTYTATAAAVVHTGAKPVLADCAGESFHLTGDAAAPLLNSRTAAVIGVDFAGICCDYDDIKAACCGLPRPRTPAALPQRPIVIADAAHSLGACVPDGRASGALADFSVFSFHAAKNLTTGEGGAVTWSVPGLDDGEFAAALARLALHGQDRTALQRENGSVFYDILTCGYKYSMTDLQAAIGLSQLGRYDAMLRRRHAIAERYLAGLPDGFSALVHPDGSSAHLFCLMLPLELAPRRDALLGQLARRGVCCNVHFQPLAMLTAYRRMGWQPEEFPNAMALFSRELSLPLSSVMTDAEADFVLDALHKAVRSL